MSSTRIQAKQRFMVWLINATSRAPLPALYVLSDLLFLVLYRLIRFQRGLLNDNLKRAFPTSSQADRDRLAANCYRNALDFLVETLKSWRLDSHEINRRVTLKNPELITALGTRHKTLIALTSHSGNWEWLQLACSAQLEAPLAALYNPLNLPDIDALLTAMRSRFGSRLIEAKSALPSLVEFSRQGGIIAINADQSPRPEDDKYWSRFLGIDTAFFTGPEKLARLFKAPVVFVCMRRLRRGYYEAEFELLSEPPYPAGQDTTMAAYIQAAEQQIRSAPQDWFWLYKRWKYPRPLYSD
jgi:Kdo2-lipid IVA lauroyltransferase/acyltransferase